MITAAASSQVLDRQLLLQLGKRLKRVRREQGISSTALAEQIGMSRTTAIESGDPSPSMGNYLCVMCALGVSSGLALLVIDTLQVTGATGRPRRSNADSRRSRQ
jgi:DNA-binding XRE family transcriptional regulator